MVFVDCTILTSPKPTIYNFKKGVITIKKTIDNKIKIFNQDYNTHVAYTYWFIKYRNYILNTFLCLLNIYFRLGYFPHL